MTRHSCFIFNCAERYLSYHGIKYKEKYEPFMAGIELTRLIDITIRGGWPETLKLPLRKSGTVANEYINAIVNNDLFRDDQSRSDMSKMRKLLQSLARNNATTVNVKTLCTEINGAEREHLANNEISILRDTVTKYLYNLKKIYVIEDIPQWDPDIRSKTILR